MIRAARSRACSFQGLDGHGAVLLFDGTETIVGRLWHSQERSIIGMISSTWRGITPIVLITMHLLGIQFRRKN